MISPPKLFHFEETRQSARPFDKDEVFSAFGLTEEISLARDAKFAQVVSLPGRIL